MLWHLQLNMRILITSNRIIGKNDLIALAISIIGRTMGKCYKLHGYHPEFKPKQKLYTGNHVLLWLIKLPIDLPLKITLPEVILVLKPSFKNLITLSVLS